MDVELRQRERDFAASPSPSALGALVRGLVRAGRTTEVATLVLEEPRRLAWLGAAVLEELRGHETLSVSEEEGAKLTSDDFEVHLVAWQVPRELGGQVFVEARRTSGVIWRQVRACDTLEVEPAMIGGVWVGHQSCVRLRLPTNQSWELAELCRDWTDGTDPGEEIARAVRRIACAAGAGVKVDPTNFIWD